MNIELRHSLATLLGIVIVIAPPGASAQQDNGFLEEIVVTAQKREQNLQDVPIAVTAYSGQMLEDSAIKDIRELAVIAPSLRSSQSQNSTTSSFGIRGVGTSGQNFGLESSVGIYIDGVYRSRQSAIINNLVDIDAVEVLRGPQGTLFGKNTPSGALNIRTVAPGHDTNGFFEITGGDLNLVNVSAGANVSLIDDVLAFRGTVFSGKRDGYVDVVGFGEDVLNDRDRFGGRAQMLYTPNDKFSVRVIADHAEISEQCCTFATRFNNFTAFDGSLGTDSFLAGVFGVPVILASQFDDHIVAYDELPLSTNEDSGISAELEYNFEKVTLTSISAFRNYDSTDFIDADFSAAPIFTDQNLAEQHSFSQELRLSGEIGDAGNYVVGAYYFTQDLNNVSTIAVGALADPLLSADPTLAAAIAGINQVSALSGGALPMAAAAFPSGAFATDDMRQEHESVALFGQVDFPLSDTLLLTAGLRFTDEKKDLDARFLNSALGPPPDVPAIVGVLTGIQIWTMDPTNPGAIDPTNPANLPLIVGTFTPVYAPGWGLYTQPSLAPQANSLDTLDDDEVTGTVKLSYTPNDRLMVYVSYGTGYKSGGTNTDRIDPFFSQLFGKETSEAIEIGFKADIETWNMRLNVAAHDTQVEDLQTSAFSGNGFNLQNAGNADTHGVEIEAWWAPTDTFDVQLSYAWNVADLEDFQNGTCWVSTPFQTGMADPGQTDPSIPVCDRSGGRVDGNPEHGVYLAAQKDFAVGNNNTFVRAEWSHLSDTMTDGNNDPLKLRDSFDNFNLRAGINFDGWNSDLSVWVRNVTDEAFFETVAEAPIQSGKLNAYPHEPRTWGVTFRKNFE